MSLGKRIQELLEVNEMEQRELAKKLHVGASSVSDWVNGKTFPRHKRLKAIAKIFNVDVAELVA